MTTRAGLAINTPSLRSIQKRRSHRVKPALGEGPPALLADRGDERLLDAVLGGGFHLPDPTRRLRSDNEPEIETYDFISCFGIGFRLPVRGQWRRASVAASAP
jgi:hypothetical protein